MLTRHSEAETKLAAKKVGLESGREFKGWLLKDGKKWHQEVLQIFQTLPLETTFG